MPRLSKWMVALRDIGVNQQDFTQIRRLRTVNVAAILAAGLTAVYGVFYAFYDAVLFSAEIRTLWVTGAGYCSVLLASRAGRIEVAMWLLLGTGILQVTLSPGCLGANPEFQSTC